MYRIVVENVNENGEIDRRLYEFGIRTETEALEKIEKLSAAVNNVNGDTNKFVPEFYDGRRRSAPFEGLKNGDGSGEEHDPEEAVVETIGDGGLDLTAGDSSDSAAQPGGGNKATEVDASLANEPVAPSEDTTSALPQKSEQIAQKAETLRADADALSRIEAPRDEPEAAKGDLDAPATDDKAEPADEKHDTAEEEAAEKAHAQREFELQEKVRRATAALRGIRQQLNDEKKQLDQGREALAQAEERVQRKLADVIVQTDRRRERLKRIRELTAARASQEREEFRTKVGDLRLRRTELRQDREAAIQLIKQKRDQLILRRKRLKRARELAAEKTKAAALQLTQIENDLRERAASIEATSSSIEQSQIETSERLALRQRRLQRYRELIEERATQSQLLEDEVAALQSDQQENVDLVVETTSTKNRSILAGPQLAIGVCICVALLAIASWLVSGWMNRPVWQASVVLKTEVTPKEIQGVFDSELVINDALTRLNQRGIRHFADADEMRTNLANNLKINARPEGQVEFQYRHEDMEGVRYILDSLSDAWAFASKREAAPPRALRERDPISDNRIAYASMTFGGSLATLLILFVAARFFALKARRVEL